MIEPGCESDLPQEPVVAHRRREIRMQHLDRYIASVTKIFCEVNRRHAAATKLTLDSITVFKCLCQLLLHLLSCLDALIIGGTQSYGTGRYRASRKMSYRFR